MHWKEDPIFHPVQWDKEIAIELQKVVLKQGFLDASYCSGSLRKGRFGYQWQAALALVGPIYDTSVESTIFAGKAEMKFETLNALL